MDKVVIYILHISLIKDNLSFISSFVDSKRKEKAERFVNENDRLLSFGAGYLLKRYLPQGEIKENEGGKPYLDNGPYFNISHSGEYVILGIHPSRDVGVDIERIDEKRLGTIRFVLNEEEKEINDIQKIFQIWSNKESLVKCKSTGIGDIRRVSGLPVEGSRVIDDKDYYVKSMVYDNYSLSVALKEKEPFEVDIKEVTSIDK